MTYKNIIKLLKRVDTSKKLLLEIQKFSKTPYFMDFHSKHDNVHVVIHKSTWYLSEMFIEMTIYENESAIYLLSGYYPKKSLKGSNFYYELDRTIGLFEQLSQTGNTGNENPY